MAIADIFVLPSEREGLSYALLEAMANGCAPVVTDIPANVEAVGDRAIRVPFGDATALEAALRHLLDEPAAVSSIGSAALERVRDRFSLEAMQQGTHRVHLSVAAP